jgi:LL-H family phage holin
MTERTMIVDALVKMAVALFMAVILPALKAWLDRNRDNKEIQQVLMLAEIAVRSVADDLKTADGQAKKDEALARLAAQIASWGLKGFTMDELTHYIGTAYTEMQENKLPEPLPVVVETE